MRADIDAPVDLLRSKSLCFDGGVGAFGGQAGKVRYRDVRVQSAPGDTHIHGPARPGALLVSRNGIGHRTRRAFRRSCDRCRARRPRRQRFSSVRSASALYGQRTGWRRRLRGRVVVVVRPCTAIVRSGRVLTAALHGYGRGGGCVPDSRGRGVVAAFAQLALSATVDFDVHHVAGLIFVHAWATRDVAYHVVAVGCARHAVAPTFPVGEPRAQPQSPN
jgi:hypothetical protein